MSAAKEVLVIKHGALGDVILATGPFASIRKTHPHANITLLTASPYNHLLNTAPFFDAIWLDEKPKPWQLVKVLKLRAMLKSKRFDWVYDLQTSKRSTSYYHLLKHESLQYSGLANGSHQHNTPERTELHTIDRQKQQLQIAGISEVLPPDITWLKEGMADLKPARKYVLLVPGGSAHRPEKRWPDICFSELARALVKQEITPVWIGAGAEAQLLEKLSVDVEQSINLCNQTSFAQIASLARKALCAVGNDTGPMHIVAATGCPSTVLFSDASNPALCAPRGKHVHIMQKESLFDLHAEEVLSSMPLELAHKKA